MAPLSAWGWDRRWMTMRLHILRGNLFTGSAGDGSSSECPAMDAAVWSKMPDDILRQVLLRLPVAKRFQLQVLSRKWLQVLTSAYFRRASASRERVDDQPVLACVTPGGDGSSSKNLKVVDIDLSFLPPEWFGTSLVDQLKYSLLGVAPPYSVLAAGEGLVCIGNKQEQVCVLNPLTRTCWMLPLIPWWENWHFSFTSAGTTVSLSALIARPGMFRRSLTWELFTWELASGGGDTKLTVKDGEAPAPGVGFVATQPLVTLCRGEVFWYVGGSVGRHREGGVLFYVRGTDVRQLLVLRDPEESNVMDYIKFASSQVVLADLGLPASEVVMWDHFSAVFMGTHRDAVFVVLTMAQHSITSYRPGHVAGLVWRVDLPDDWSSGASTRWWGARLLTDTVEELTGLRFADHADATVGVCFVLGMRELLCCGVEVCDPDREPQRFVLGLNLETIHREAHVWKLVHDEQGLMRMEDDGSGMALKVAKTMELRPQ